MGIIKMTVGVTEPELDFRKSSRGKSEGKIFQILFVQQQQPEEKSNI